MSILRVATVRHYFFLPIILIPNGSDHVPDLRLATTPLYMGANPSILVGYRGLTPRGAKKIS